MDFKLFVRHKGFHIIFYKGYLKKALLFHLIVDVIETIEKEEMQKNKNFYNSNHGILTFKTHVTSN